MAHLSEKELLDAIGELVAIESTATNPEGLRAAYAYMKELVARSGKDIVIEEFESNGKPSFLAYRTGARPKKFDIILNGHVDVVPGKSEQFKPHIENGKLYGRGVYDMKAAAIILAEAFCEYVDLVPFTLGLQIVTDEEPGGPDGTLYQVMQGVRTDLVICGECGRKPGNYEIVNETKGVIFADIEIKGETAHGAYPWRGNNAAAHAAQFIQALQAIYPSPGLESHDTTVTITGISSTSGAHNKLPEHALIMVDCRFTSEDPHFKTPEAFRKFIATIDPEASVTKFHAFAPPVVADPNHSLIVTLKQAAETVENHSFSFVRRHGGSDTRHYMLVGGQAYEFGIAGENQHGDRENISLDALWHYRDTMQAFLENVAKTATRESQPETVKA
jgi:succinyl-diaminopimelate desuccinylase